METRTIEIHIRYFASLREIVGLSEESINIHEETSVAQIREQLATRYPRLQTILERSISAVNRRYVAGDTILHEGDELVFVPPMGGGELSWNQ